MMSTRILNFKMQTGKGFPRNKTDDTQHVFYLKNNLKKHNAIVPDLVCKQKTGQHMLLPRSTRREKNLYCQRTADTQLQTTQFGQAP